MDPVGLNDLAELWAPAMLRACWQGALAAGGVWLLCRLLPRLSPGVRATLWWLVCAKIVLGLFFATGVPVAVLPAEREEPASIEVAIPVSATSTDLYAEPVAVESMPAQVAGESVPLPAPISAPEAPSTLTLLLLIWGAGVVTLLALTLHEQNRIQRVIADARPCADLRLLSELAATEGLRHMPPVLVSDTLPGSLVVGIWRPTIVLAQTDLDGLGAEEKWALLAHELAHIRRGDLWMGMLPNLARAAFFFHPFVWLACREYELAREAACDAESLRVSGLPAADYGRLLLKLSLPPTGPALRPGAAALGVASPHARILLRRLQGLQKLKAQGSLPQWCSLVVLALVGMLLSLTPTRAKIRTLIAAPALIEVHQDAVDTVPAQAVIAQAAGTPAEPPEVAMDAGPELAQIVIPPADVKGNQPVMKLSLKSTPKLARTATVAAALATVSAPAMMATKAANAQDTPPIPAVPPTPAVAAAAPAAVALPVPAAPAAPEAPFVATLQARKYQYTMRTGTSYSTHVSDRAVATAQRKLAEAQPGDCLIVDRDGKRYLITDAATLRQIKENYAAVEAKGKQMELKGKEMEKIGLPMEALGKQMEALGKVMEARGKEMGILGEKLGTANETERAAIHEQMKALREQMMMPTEEMRALGKKMREHGDKMRIPGDQMREMGTQIRAAVKQAEERMVVILDNAFKNNLAVEQAGSTGSTVVEYPLD